MYYKGTGVPQDYVSANMQWNICGSSGNKDCAEAINIVKKKMTPSQIEKAQKMARNWKPTVSSVIDSPMPWQIDTWYLEKL